MMPVLHGTEAALKPLNRYFDAIARPSLERHGFAYAELLRNWARIAPDVAAFARPESLHFPRRAGKGRTAAHLRLRVQPGRALEMQHMQGQIIERINAYFGYNAVARLSFVQAPLAGAEEETEKAPLGRPDPAVLERLRRAARAVSDPDLRESLARLAEGVSALTARKS